MKYRHSDGFTFEADTPEQAAQILWKSMFIPNDTIEEWMHGSSMRAGERNGVTLRTDTVEHHIEDMLRAGWLEILEE